MIKIMHIITDSNIGGAGRHLLTLLKYHDRSNFDIQVVVPRGSALVPRIQALGIPVTELDGIAERSFSPFSIRSLKRLITANHTDLVHTHGCVSGRIAAKLSGTKVIYTRHCVFPVKPILTRGLPKRIYGRIHTLLADGIIAVADAARKNLTDCGIEEERIHVILNGVEPQIPVCEERVLQLKQQYSIDKDCFTAGILARLENDKGHRCIIEAAEKVKSSGRRFKLLIAGAGSQEAALRELVSEKDLEDTVIFTGFVQQVSDILSLLDVQLNASIGTEASSLSLIEGMSMGIPAIASDYGGNPQVISHCKNGYIFKQQDSDGLARCILKLMDEPETRNQMKAQALQIFAEVFDAGIFTKNTESYYRKILEV